MNGLHAALATIDDFAAVGNLGADVTARLRVIVEELFSNTIKYGYAGECEHPVRLRLAADADVRLVFEDEAPHFDPTGWRRIPDPAVPPEDRPPGQAGIALVLGLVRSAVYEEMPCGNRLTLTLQAGS
jgi:anti-sigma regulatory factor (Ser/Thr protein kinase)